MKLHYFKGICCESQRCRLSLIWVAGLRGVLAFFSSLLECFWPAGVLSSAQFQQLQVIFSPPVILTEKAGVFYSPLFVTDWSRKSNQVRIPVDLCLRYLFVINFLRYAFIIGVTHNPAVPSSVLSVFDSVQAMLGTNTLWQTCQSHFMLWKWSIGLLGM